MTPRQVLQTLLPLGLIAAAVFFAQQMIFSRPKPPKKPRAERAVLVEASPVKRIDRDVVVRANGTVIPAYSVELMSEIGGRVVWKNPQLTAGGQIKEGEPLIKIDPRDYRLSVAQQQAALERARTEIELEQGRGEVAAQEWAQFGEGAKAANAELALRKPQMRAAELGLKTAETSLKQARMQLGKTSIKSPFDAFVRVNATEAGRLVSPGQSLATLVATRVFTVVVSLPVDDLAWLKVPGTNAPLLTDESLAAAYAAEDQPTAFAKLGSLAMITQEVGSQKIQRPGIAVRLLGELDPVGRMARLLVSVQDPLGLNDPESERAGELPILLGAYVKVELQGKVVEDVVEVPRVALRDGDRVYVYQDARLEVRDVKVLRRDDDVVLVSAGLDDGDMLITSSIASPVVGMELRLPEPKADPKKKKVAGDPASGEAETEDEESAEKSG